MTASLLHMIRILSRGTTVAKACQIRKDLMAYYFLGLSDQYRSLDEPPNEQKISETPG